jgi:sugar phosphate isomerase/epimerase
MRFGAMNFPILPVVQEIEAIGALGLDYVELAMDPPQAHHTHLRRQKHAIRNSLAAWNLDLICHLPTFVQLADLTPGLRQASLVEMLGALETAADLGARKAVLHPGYFSGLGGYVPDQVVALAMESLARVYERSQSLGLTVCLENLFQRFSPFVTPDQFEPLFEAFPGFSLILDLAHAYIGERSSARCLEFLTRFGDRLAHLHVSDNQGRRDDHLPLGSGSLPLKTIVNALKETGYDDTCTLEIFVEDRHALIKSRDKMSALLARDPKSRG